MTPTSPCTPAVELSRPSGVEQSNPSGQGSHDQPQLDSAVDHGLRPIPLFSRLVRAIRAGDNSQIDELRKQLSGLGWSIRHHTESTARAAEESDSLPPRTKSAGPR